MVINARDNSFLTRLTISAGGPRASKSFTDAAKPRASSSSRVGTLTVTPNSAPPRHTKHRKKKKQPPTPDSPEVEDERATPPPKPGGMNACIWIKSWSQFEDHVKVVSGADLFLGEKKESYSNMCSEDHQKTLTEIKELSLKKQARSMKMRLHAVHVMQHMGHESEAEETAVEPSSEDESSEDEQEKHDRERKRVTARQHWGLIRRYVLDRIQRRKKKSGFNKDRAFSRLRAQAKASLNPEQTRKDIFERYGIIPKPGRLHPEDVMKPIFSTRAQDIIARFEQIEVISIVANDNRQRAQSYKRQRERRESRMRPKTTGRILTKRFR